VWDSDDDDDNVGRTPSKPSETRRKRGSVSTFMSKAGWRCESNRCGTDNADGAFACTSCGRALALACIWGRPQVVKRLLPFVDVNSRSESGMAPLDIVCSRNHVSLPAGTKLLPRTDSHLTCLEMLLDARADPNAVCDEGRTALHATCFFGLTDCARLLIKAGCDSSVEDCEGDTALHFAEAEGHTELTAELPDMIRVQRKKQRNQARKQRKETRNQKALQAGLLEPEPELEEVHQAELAELGSVKGDSKQGTEEEGHGSPPVSPVNC
jgi:hypothetical protein